MAHILVLEDDPDTRETLERLLQHAGHEVTTAGDGRAGARLLAQGGYDLLITDIIMPDQDGLATILEAKRSLPELPIIAMSGGGQGSSDDYLRIARAFGARQVCPKPFKPEQILAQVEAALAA